MCCTPCLPALLGQTCCQPSRVTRTRTHWNTKYTRADMDRSICMHAHTLAKHRNHDMAQERVREIYIWSMAPEQIYIHAPFFPPPHISMNLLSLSLTHTLTRALTHVLTHAHSHTRTRAHQHADISKSGCSTSVLLCWRYRTKQQPHTSPAGGGWRVGVPTSSLQ